MGKVKIVRTDCEIEVPAVDKKLQEAGFDLILLPEEISEDELHRNVKDAELILMNYTPITAAIIESAPKLKGIVKYGVGIDTIDIPAAHAKNIVVVNVPEYAEETVAEGAFAMMISLAKKMPALQNEMLSEGWAWPEQKWIALDLAEKTLGIVGCGKIGKSMARMAGAGFRMKVIGYDPHKSRKEMEEAGIIKCDDLKEMLSKCDFISLHSVLSNDSRHVIGKEELAVIKQHAILINAARGALVDEEELVKMLTEGKIAGAGLDVFSVEPIRKSNHIMSPLYGMKNVILMPHITFYTKKAMERLEQETLDRCFEILEERPVLIKSNDPRLKLKT